MANQEFVVESDRTTAVFEWIEEIIEDFGLARLMEETEDEDNERLSKDKALKYYQALKGNNVDS